MRLYGLQIRKRLCFCKISTAILLTVISWKVMSNIYDNETYGDGFRTESKPRLSVIQKVRVFPRGGDDIQFDQPWPLSNISTIANLNEVLSKSQLYFVSNFSYSPGLGNLMFQYAALKSLAIKFHAKLLLAKSCKLRRAFNLDAIYLDDNLVESLLHTLNVQKIDFKECCKYQGGLVDKISMKSQKSIQIFTGYFQTFHYFHPHLKEMITKEFTFLPGIASYAKKFFAHAKSRIITTNQEKERAYKFIGVHVRRGIDITMNSRNSKHGHIPADSEYYEAAMNYFRSRHKSLIFMVSTDNRYWTKKNLKSAKTGEIFFISTGYREVDMAILALCDHVIMSTGTFSWWSAYLARGSAIYFKNWPKNGSVLDQMVDKTGYFLPEWISL